VSFTSSVDDDAELLHCGNETCLYGADCDHVTGRCSCDQLVSILFCSISTEKFSEISLL
jgi:hypothetical protein